MPLFEHVRQQLSPFHQARRWLVAYSGGVDSLVLLHTLSLCRQQLPLSGRPQLLAVHINHQLQASAGQWVEHCQQQAKHLGIELLVKPVSVVCEGGDSLEDKARQARYAAFESVIDPGDVLMMGHHLDDQVETLMLRLLRGSGSRGASAMPHRRAISHGELFRPLLDISRSDIERYAVQAELSWIEDPSNQSTRFDRNYLRHELFPVLAKRWPEYRQTLARAAALIEESSQLNDELAMVDLSQLGLSESSSCIALPGFRDLTVARQKNLLRYWLRQRGLPAPSAVQLQAVLDEVVAAKADAEPLMCWKGAEVRRFKDELYCMSPLAAIDTSVSYHWDVSRVISMPDVGDLSVSKCQGGGISLLRLQDRAITIRFRQGGERCQPAGRSGSQSLKKLFQEYAVEPWLRDRVPLLYCGEELIAVADLWVCHAWLAVANEDGWRVHWQPVK